MSVGIIDDSQLQTLEDLCAKSKGGQRVNDMVIALTQDVDTYFFGEVLQVLENKQQVVSDDVYSLVKLFCYGSLHDYNNSSSSGIKLNKAQTDKLLMLTALSFARRHRVFEIDRFGKEFDVAQGDVEKCIIQAMYKGLIDGKFDDQSNTFRVSHVLSRDIDPNQLNELESILEKWQLNCQQTLQTLSQSSQNAVKASEDSLLIKKDADNKKRRQRENIDKKTKTPPRSDDVECERKDIKMFRK